MKDQYHLIYHSQQKTYYPSRERVAYLIRAARSRGYHHRPMRMKTGDIVLRNVATLFLKRPAQA